MRKTRAARPVAPGRRNRGLVSVGTPSSSAIVPNGRMSQWIPAGGSFGLLAELEARLWSECVKTLRPRRRLISRAGSRRCSGKLRADLFIPRPPEMAATQPVGFLPDLPYRHRIDLLLREPLSYCLSQRGGALRRRRHLWLIPDTYLTARVPELPPLRRQRRYFTAPPVIPAIKRSRNRL